MLSKIARDILTIRRNLTAERPRPLSMSVNITGRCNLRCSFCEKAGCTRGPEIALDDLKKLIDFSIAHDLAVFMGGGEPFLHAGIWDLLAYCHSVSKRVSFVTNGALLNGLSDERFDLLAKAVGAMSISIDSADPAEHDRMRGVNGTWNKAMGFIRDERRATRAGLNCLLTPELDRAGAMIDLAAELGCSLNFQPLIFESNFPDLPRAKWKEQAVSTFGAVPQRGHQLRALHKQAGKLGVVTNLGLIRRYFDTYCRYANTQEQFADHLLRQFTCFIPFQQITIDELGRLAPCVLLASEASAFDGDLYENWLAVALKYRELWRSGHRFGACRSCSCHFAENYRSSILAHPLANTAAMPWMLVYYAGRLYRREGRKV